MYKNPFLPDRCFLLTFDNSKEIPDQVLDFTPTDMHSTLLFYYEQNSLFVTHVKNNNFYFNIFNFIKDSNTLKFVEIASKKHSLIQKYKPLIWFIHEIYHLKDLDFKKDYIYDEADADLFAALVIYKTYNISMDELKRLIVSLYDLRVNEIDINLKSDKDKIESFEKYYKSKSLKAIKNIKSIKNDDFKSIYNIIN